MKASVAIIGGGPGGCAAALFLAQKGVSCVVIEKERFPRFHVGESMTGECGGAVRALGLEQRMLDDKHPMKWGTKVLGPGGKNSFYVPVMARTPQRQLVDNFVWSVRRSHFDQMMLTETLARKVPLVEGEAVEAIRDGDQVRGVKVRRPNGTIDTIEAAVIIDASGQNAFLSRTGVASPRELGHYEKQVAIYSHLSGAIRDPGRESGNTLIFYQKKLHWAWFIPLDAEVTSVGVVVPTAYFSSCKESKRDFLVRELGELNDDLTKRLPKVHLVEDVRAIPNYSYQVRKFTGKGFLCIGDAHRFIDPIFSLGLCFTMLEAQQAATAVAEYLAGAHRDEPNPFADYERRCEAGQDVIQELIDAFWEQPMAFSIFVHHRYRDDCIDMFAGRVYMDEPSPGLRAMQRINEHTRKQNAVAR
jgi:flavin-dependent dehydrogenase